MTEGTCFVAPGNEFGFVDVPKVMSTSIKAAIFNINAPTRDIHAIAEQYRVPISKARRDGVFLFSFVRNPAKRLVSAWANRVYEPEGGRSRLTDPAEDMFTSGMSFSDFVTRLEEIGVDVERHLRPQIDYIMPNGRLVADFVGRSERWSRDWMLLSRMFDLPPLPKLNSTKTENPLNKALMLRIRKLYAKDYAAFGYGAK